MSTAEESEFALEYHLKKLNPELHTRFTDSVFGLQNILSKYKMFFPEFTDHTELHSLTVINFCKLLIGQQLEKLNADELYALLMGCYLHDTGMGLTPADYEEFAKNINFGDYFTTHSYDPPVIIRDFHNEFSGQFIKKYAPFFEIPSPVHLRIIVQIARGHRKTNLMDEEEYPLALPVPGGNTVCLPYLAALIRLADEIDVTAARNPILMYDLEALTDETQILEHKKHKAVHSLQVTENAFTLLADCSDPGITGSLQVLAGKMQHTLDECRKAVNGRTPFMITQEQVFLQPLSTLRFSPFPGPQMRSLH